MPVLASTHVRVHQQPCYPVPRVSDDLMNACRCLDEGGNLNQYTAEVFKSCVRDNQVGLLTVVLKRRLSQNKIVQASVMYLGLAAA